MELQKRLVIAKSRSEINLRETISNEFSVVLEALFAADSIGTVLHCSSKSSLTAILEKLPTNK